MCGICGYALGQQNRLPCLRVMTNLLEHRGPDGEGMLDDGQVAIGMRRLAIIDVAGGHQPIPNEDESIWVVPNGGIYNYQEFRRALIQGHSVVTG